MKKMPNGAIIVAKPKIRTALFTNRHPFDEIPNGLYYSIDWLKQMQGIDLQELPPQT